MGTLAVAVLLGGCLCVSAAAAQDAEVTTFRVVVRSPGDDVVFFERVRGHTSDLDVEVVVDSTPIEAQYAEQLASADQLAAEEQARIVVWLEHVRPGVALLTIAEPAQDRYLLRVPDMSDDEGQVMSGLYESASFIVAEAIRALQAGTVFGESRASALETRAERVGDGVPPDEPVERPPPPVVAPDPVRPPPPRGPPISVDVAVGAELGADGVHPRANLGPTVLGRLNVGIFDVGLLVAVGLPGEIDATVARFDVTRLVFGAVAGVHLPLGALRLGVGLELGAAGLLRSTTATAPNATAGEDAGLWSVYFGPRLTATLAVVGSLFVALEATLRIVPSAPDLGYVDGSGFVPTHAVWRVQPGAALALGVRFGEPG